MGKIGIFGGTFDPIHSGHLIMAQDAAEFGKLDKVLIMPSAVPPLRRQAPIASGDERLEMVRLAISSNPLFEACELDLNAIGASYSINVVEKIADLYPGDTLYWILGADQIAQLDQWHRIEDLAKLVNFIALQRPGFSDKPKSLPTNATIEFAPTHAFDISASEIRQRLENQQNVKYFLPHEVFEYIKAGYLYTLKTKSI